MLLSPAIQVYYAEQGRNWVVYSPGGALPNYQCPFRTKNNIEEDRMGNCDKLNMLDVWRPPIIK